LTLTSGARLGPYEILSPLRAGGVGEVFRARDTKLNRDVALKISPRFRQRSRSAGAVRGRSADARGAQSPNISTIYGIEESNPLAASGQTAVRALVMELVDGDDLCERIARGPIPLDEAIPIARQIANALGVRRDRRVRALIDPE
jgi:serine/threonine protein kinase